jgi:site-specific DNA-methyltransferase (adenine-specific)
MYKKIDVVDLVLRGDCLDVMGNIPDNVFDMTFADPPFNLNKKYGSYKDNMSESDYLAWSIEWIYQMVRITKPAGTIFVHHIPKWLILYGHSLNHIAKFRHWISWDTSSAPLGKTLLPYHYGILYYTKLSFVQRDYKFYDIRIPHKKCMHCKGFVKDYGGKKANMHPFGALASDVWTDIHRIKHKVRRVAHPCQLPVPLLERLILMSTDEGDMIFDPFMGSGTTAIAARRLGRRFVGAEMNRDYVDIINEKLEDIVPTQINDCYVSIYLDQIRTIRDKDSKFLEKYDNIPRKVKSTMEQPIFNVEDE